MKRVFSLTVLVLVVAGFAGLTLADDRESKVNLADLRNQPAIFDGRIVEVSGRVIAISADSKSMELFDSQTRTTIVVRLSGLNSLERSNVITNSVHNVTV